MIHSSIVFTLLVITGAATLRAQVIITSFVPDAVNQLTLEQGPDADGSIIAMESIPPNIGNQINLTYTQNFEFASQNVPSGWSFQNVDTGTEKIASFFFSGTNSETSNEFYDFNDPITFRFSVVALAGADSTAPFTLGGDLAVIPGFATIPLTGSYSATVIPEPSFTQLFFGVACSLFTLAIRWRVKVS